jgi:hypothetical protein
VAYESHNDIFPIVSPSKSSDQSQRKRGDSLVLSPSLVVSSYLFPEIGYQKVDFCSSS